MSIAWLFLPFIDKAMLSSSSLYCETVIMSMLYQQLLRETHSRMISIKITWTFHNEHVHHHTQATKGLNSQP